MRSVQTTDLWITFQIPIPELVETCPRNTNELALNILQLESRVRICVMWLVISEEEVFTETYSCCFYRSRSFCVDKIQIETKGSTESVQQISAYEL